MNDVWAIVLAAGQSTRMHRQKLLLSFRNKTIVETVIDAASEIVGANVMVVLGANNEEILDKIGNRSIEYCVNKNFKEGMLSSVICGFRALPDNAKAALVFLGDQPQIPSEVGNQVTKAWKSNNKGIVIPKYQKKRGHPILIETKYALEIESLNPEEGLRSLSAMYRDDVLELECSSPEILRDIDTPDEYKAEINKIL